MQKKQKFKIYLQKKLKKVLIFEIKQKWKNIDQITFTCKAFFRF